VQGRTLEKELQEEGIFAEAQIWDLLRNLLPVLQYIHERATIHRDIKPENIMRREEDGIPVLIDFGVAKLLSESAQRRPGTQIGTQGFAAPEQINGRSVPASDLYSLGITLIYLLTGVSTRKMYDAENCCWRWQEYLPPGTKISDRLARILNRLCQYHLRDRYSQVVEVKLDLETASSEHTEAILTSPPLSATPNVSAFAPSSTTQTPPSIVIEYPQLENLLAQQQWQQADRETHKILCQALGKALGMTIESSEIDYLPLDSLLAIDKLWADSSKGRFGFTVQGQIYEQVHRNYIRFCQQVGWPSYNSASYYRQLKFSHLAPWGHLPSRIWVGGNGWQNHAAAMLLKMSRSL